MKIKDLTRIALFVAIMIICSYLTVPFAVPFTLQILGVFLAVLVLGKNKGSLAILIYLLLGICGAPVFSGMKGGITAFLTPAGGYLVSFLISGYITGFIYEKTEKNLLSCIAGLVICYICAYSWCFVFYPVKGIFLTMIAPFIIPDILKISIAVYLSNKLKADFTA